MRFITAALATILITTAGCEDLLDVDHHPVTGDWRGQDTNAGVPTFLDVQLVERSGGQLSGMITITAQPAIWVEDRIVGTNRNLCVTIRSARGSQVYFRGSLANPTWIEGHFDPGGLNALMALASSPGPAFAPAGPVEDHCD
jgi:hypothetical protein